jgi:hypothetical protein
MAFDGIGHRVYNLRGRTVHSFDVAADQLGQGTETSPGTRDFVNGQVAAPQEVGFSYSAGRKRGGGEFANEAPAGGGRWDAGHLLGRQNGGLGDVNAGVFPQNPQINRGNRLNGKPTRDTWRAHEDVFHSAVEGSGRGQWSVTTRDRPRVRYDQFF